MNSSPGCRNYEATKWLLGLRTKKWHEKTRSWCDIHLTLEKNTRTCAAPKAGIFLRRAYDNLEQRYSSDSKDKGPCRSPNTRRWTIRITNIISLAKDQSQLILEHDECLQTPWHNSKKVPKLSCPAAHYAQTLQIRVVVRLCESNLRSRLFGCSGSLHEQCRNTLNPKLQPLPSCKKFTVYCTSYCFTRNMTCSEMWPRPGTMIMAYSSRLRQGNEPQLSLPARTERRAPAIPGLPHAWPLHGPDAAVT